MKARRHSEIKQLEADRRLGIIRSKGTRTATRVQRRVSLVGNAAMWRITNWRQVASAMAKWA
ncbi:MAG: hypothetical protein WCS94_14660 [Verrucomicrobiota bacterium]